MSTALRLPEGSVRRTHFPALCGSLACQETGEHSHPDCPECGRPLVPGLASLGCWMCRLACYGQPSRNYPFVLAALSHETVEDELERAVARLRRYEVEPGRCGRGHTTQPLRLWDCPACTQALRSALAEIHALGMGEASAIAGRALGIPAQGLERVS